MGRDSDRLDGWKAIGAHFGRDRTTAIRWARDRDLPVRSLPGGKTRTVYAFRSELDGWARAVEHTAKPAPDPARSDPKPVSGRGWRSRIATGAAIISLAAVGWATIHRSAARDPATPADTATAALYLEARDEWAQRTASSLAAAAGHLREVNRRAPTFAPAYAALADTELLMREFGPEPETFSYARARIAAEQALRLDPDLPAAWRALGFLAYWVQHDRAVAARDLHEALLRDPTDPQTRFWIANILADNGEFNAAERLYAVARLREPGSLPIRAEQAWAHWSAGSPGADNELRAVARQRPDFAVAHECLSMIRLLAGDWPGYLAERRNRAMLRGEAGITADAARAERAFASGGAPALRALIAGDVAARKLWSSDAPLAAVFLTVAGDRQAVLHLLIRAERRHERWGWAGYRRWLAMRWRGDRAITTLLARRAPPSMAGVIEER